MAGKVVLGVGCFGTPYAAVKQGATAATSLPDVGDAPERWEDAFKPFPGVSVVQSQSAEPPEIARVRRGLVGSYGGSIPMPHRDGSGWGWTAIDLDRWESVT